MQILMKFLQQVAHIALYKFKTYLLTQIMDGLMLPSKNPRWRAVVILNFGNLIHAYNL